MTSHINVGVVGAGVFGTYHARKCQAHKDVTYLGSFDPDYERAEQVSKDLGGQAYKTPEDLAQACDALIIASPATTHGSMGQLSLMHGCHTLIEKPIAHTLQQAQSIADLANETGKIVQIGHQERFVIDATGLKDIPETPRKIKAVRNAPYSQRGLDVSVTLDLMTHDIDMVLWLMGGEPESVCGQTSIVKSRTIDEAVCEMDYPQTSIRLEAKRTAPASQRFIELEYYSGKINIDYNAKTLQNTTTYKLNADFGQSSQAIDSLGAAFDSFISSVTDNSPVRVTALEGLAALKIALKVDSSL